MDDLIEGGEVALISLRHSGTFDGTGLQFSVISLNNDPLDSGLLQNAQRGGSAVEITRSIRVRQESRPSYKISYETTVMPPQLGRRWLRRLAIFGFQP
jgi:hypothetical protein